jgi:hypothetical protein
MALAVGPITAVQTFATSAQLSVAAATGGTGPYTYQWYKSFTTGFTPGTKYLINGATALTFTDTGLQPATEVYYEVIVTDLGNGSATADSAQLGVTTLTGSPQDPNQFMQSVVLGQPGDGYQTGTWSGRIDSSYGTGLIVPGTAVKNINPTGGTQGYPTQPTFVPATANSDSIVGFIFYSIRNQTFTGGSPFEYASGGDVIYLLPTANGNQGDFAQLDVTVPGGVCSKVGSSGAIVVGTFEDQPYVGQPCRVKVQLPTTVTA